MYDSSSSVLFTCVLIVEPWFLTHASSKFAVLLIPVQFALSHTLFLINLQCATVENNFK